MTPAQRKRIVAELRRSAVEDASPSTTASDEAWGVAIRYKPGERSAYLILHDDLRTFFLLVAHALEDER